jgi:Flp pilus assembly protein TadG
MPRSFAAAPRRAFRAKSWTFRRLLRALRKSEDGQAVAELALAVPVLLIVVLGIVDFGRAVNYWNNETHLAAIGARYAAVGGTGGTCNGTDYSTGHTLEAYLLCEAGVDSKELQEGSKGSTGAQGQIKVCVSIPKAEVGAPVTVWVTTKYSWLPMPAVLGGGFKFAETGLQGKATTRLEQVSSSGVATTTGECT